MKQEKKFYMFLLKAVVTCLSNCYVTKDYSRIIPTLSVLHVNTGNILLRICISAEYERIVPAIRGNIVQTESMAHCDACVISW
jgi:hypothetical protein